MIEVNVESFYVLQKISQSKGGRPKQNPFVELWPAIPEELLIPKGVHPGSDWFDQLLD